MSWNNQLPDGDGPYIEGGPGMTQRSNPNGHQLVGIDFGNMVDHRTEGGQLAMQPNLEHGFINGFVHVCLRVLCSVFAVLRTHSHNPDSRIPERVQGF